MAIEKSLSQAPLGMSPEMMEEMMAIMMMGAMGFDDDFDDMMPKGGKSKKAKK